MASVIDLVGIKSAIKTILSDANTVGASPVDLSNGMSQRVKSFYTVNPELIPTQNTLWPYVTTYIGSKSINSDDIAKTQLDTKRKSELEIFIIAGLYNNSFSDKTKDPADDDINYLMENIEIIMRSNYNLNAKVSWPKPSRVEYYSGKLNEQAHVRFGILTINAIVYY